MNEAEPSRRVTAVGLGPGTWESLTVEAAETLRTAREVWLRTTVQPPFDAIRQHLDGVTVHSFDDLYEQLDTLDEVHEAICDRLLELASRPEGVVYAVPGSAAWGDTPVRLLRDRGAEVRIVGGMSFMDTTLGAVGGTDAGWLQALDAGEAALMGEENAFGEVAGSDAPLPWRAPLPTVPLLISNLYSRDIASGIKLWLGRYYPDTHAVRLVHGADGRVEELPLFELDRGATIDERTSLYVPPVPDTENIRTFAGLMNVTRRLRAPGGCPWDREQTHASLKTYLLEEAYEAIDALDSGDPELLSEELGDLLFQVCIHSQVAAELGEFTIEDVIGYTAGKMVGRHPHVFGELQLESADDVRNVWESFKQREKPKRESILEEIPKGLPALPQSQLMQKRAASVGFEWPDVEGVFAKVEEELRELRSEVESSGEKDRQREELGDLFFALGSVARHLRIDPEEALRLANRKFESRFRYVEGRLSGTNRTLRDLSPDELDALWNEAKEASPEPA